MGEVLERAVDVAIIGAGTAGMGAYRAALEHTDNVLIIESGPYGTTCARVGCMPSKLLIAAADAAHAVRRAAAFGVMVPAPVVDGRAVMARVRSGRDRFVGFVSEAVDRWPAHHRVRGHARFLGPDTLMVQGLSASTLVRAKRVVIATGSRPAVPLAWRTALGPKLIVNDDIFDWEQLPNSVAVVGTGVVGIEIAQSLHRLGVRVRLFGRDDRIGPLTDPALQKLARSIYDAALPVTLETTHFSPSLEGHEVVVRFGTADGHEYTERFEWLLAATGRIANLENLDLHKLGLTPHSTGRLPVDPATGQIGDLSLFLAGDASQRRAILHEAADEGRIAGDNAGRYPDIRARPRRTPLTVVFSDPQMMLAGASHAELTASGRSFAEGSVSFEDQGRARVMGVNHGSLKVYADAHTGQVLGAEMIGPAAENIGHLLAWSIQRGDTVQQILEFPFYHPVIEEGVRTAMRELRRSLRMGPPPIERCLDCGPGA